LFFIPMAWDRYYLPIQAPAAIAGAASLVAIMEWVRGRGRPTGHDA
jgi:hypothetical protein